MILNICLIVDFKNLVSLVSVKNCFRTKIWFSELAEGELKDFVKASFQSDATSSIYDFYVDVDVAKMKTL